jgi:hypothetical protein
MSNPTPRMREEFRSAQGPWMWLHAADSLRDAAALIFHSAADQLSRHDTAAAEATRKAEEIHARDPTQAAIVEIDCEEPRFLTAFLLYGYAVENLLKGFYVAKNPAAIGDERVRIPAHHNLRELADAAGYIATASEIKLMEKLTTVTTWSGRYPVAKTVREHGTTGVNREGLFDDPIKTAAEIVVMIQKLRGLLDDGEPRPKCGVIVVWSGDDSDASGQNQS